MEIINKKVEIKTDLQKIVDLLERIAIAFELRAFEYKHISNEKKQVTKQPLTKEQQELFKKRNEIILANKTKSPVEIKLLLEKENIKTNTKLIKWLLKRGEVWDSKTKQKK